MALGRSNSLSINTGAANNTFGQSNQQPAAGGGLFGGSIFGNKPASATTGTGLFGQPATTTTASTGGLFGSAAATSQPAASGGLFGAATSQPAASGGLFGAATSQPAQTGGLFGAATSQPAQTGGLFGATTNNTTSLFDNNAATTQPTQTGGLFGAANNNTTSLFGNNATTAQPAQTGGLFGATANNNAGSLFGNQNKPAGGGLFGGSLFGNNTATAQPAAGGLFGSTMNNNNVQQSAQSQTPSLLSASRYNLGQPAPFTGRLTMGQGNAQQSASVPAAKLDWDNVRPTTRYADLVDTARAAVDKLDEMIKAQEDFCKQIEALLPAHGRDLSTLQPDIELIKGKCEAAEQSLIGDAQDIQQVKLLTQKDNKDILRCERITENLRLPAQYHYAPAASGYGGARSAASKTGETGLEEEFDVNLINNYFTPMASDMQTLLEAYSSNLQEIESHLSTIEASAVAQAQALAGQRSGQNGNDSVRQLADTLHGFEATILATASKVGAVREGVTKLSLANAY